MSEPNGRYLWLKILLPIFGVVFTALVGYGALKSNVAHVEQELPRIEARTDQKLAQQRELILSKFDDVIRRLERIERRLP